MRLRTVLLIAAVAVFAYVLGRDHERTKMLERKVDRLDDRISQLELTNTRNQIKTEERWAWLKRIWFLIPKPGFLAG